MSTKELASQYRLSQWAQIMQERVASGESIRLFCERRKISRHGYFYWQRKLREATGAALRTQRSEKMIPTGWAVCESEAEPIQKSGVTIEIGNCRILADAATSPEALEKVCRVLMGLC